MFIVENTDTLMEGFNSFPEITDWSDDSYNILESSLFFDENISKTIKAASVAEVMAYNEGSIESFNEGAFETVKNKIIELWKKFKAFVGRVIDRLLAWVRKHFMSNESFWSKYGTVIEKNMYKVVKKNPKFKFFDMESAAEADDKLQELFNFNFSGKEEEARKTYDEKISDLADVKKDINTVLDKSEEMSFKDILDTINKSSDSDFKISASSFKKDMYKNFDRSCKEEKKAIEKQIKEAEDELKTFNNPKGIMLHQELKTKLQKACLTAKLDIFVKTSKKCAQLMTNIAYEAVKLQNTKEEDIKEESASIDILNKYLQRI